MTVRDFLVDEWLPAKRSTIKPSMFSTYRTYVESYIVPKLGSLSLAGLRAPQLNDFYAGLLETGRCSNGKALSPKMVRNIHGAIHKALDDAVRWGRLSRNPADVCDPPKSAPPEMSTWTAEQLRAFVGHVRDNRLAAAWVLFATTGMRRGELLGLRWSDIDFYRSRVSIRQTQTVVDYEVIRRRQSEERGPWRWTPRR